jgi:hypothetical protein
MEEIPLSQLFVALESDNSNFNTLDWLQSLNVETLKRLIECGDSYFQLDIDDEADFDCIDYVTLSLMIGEQESKRNIETFNDDEKAKCIAALNVLSHCESLRRGGFVTINGDGKITSFHDCKTTVELTEMGERVGDSIKTLQDVSEAVEELNN